MDCGAQLDECPAELAFCRVQLALGIGIRMTCVSISAGMRQNQSPKELRDSALFCRQSFSGDLFELDAFVLSHHDLMMLAGLIAHVETVRRLSDTQVSFSRHCHFAESQRKREVDETTEPS